MSSMMHRSLWSQVGPHALSKVSFVTYYRLLCFGLVVQDYTVNDRRWKASAGCTLAESRPAPAADEIEDLGKPTKNGKAVMNDRGSGRLIADAMLQAAQW